MAEESRVRYRVVATVVAAKGHCGAGHKPGDSFEISCLNAAGLCGHFYHDIFPDLQTLEFGGRMPWWQGEWFEATCSDTGNPVTLRLERTPRE